MRLLGIMGSPRIRGNTDIALDEAIKGAKSAGAQVEKIIVNKFNISGCRECLGCYEEGNCVIQDDMQNIYPALIGVERLLVASPIFFYGIPSQAKALIDRCQVMWARKYILKQQLPSGRKGAFIGIAATQGPSLFDGARLTVKYFFEALNIEYVDEILVRGIDKKGRIKDHPTALKEAFELGKRLVSNR